MSDRVIYTVSCESHGSAVGIATGCGLDDQGVRIRIPAGTRIFSSPCRPDRLWDLPSLPCDEYRGFSHLGVKRLGREADHSSPTCAKVKKTWIYTSTLPYVFMAQCLSSLPFLTVLFIIWLCQHNNSIDKQYSIIVLMFRAFGCYKILTQFTLSSNSSSLHWPMFPFRNALTASVV
jgi:hypothetical protein